MLDSDRIKSDKTCVSLDSFHKDTKIKFMEILSIVIKQNTDIHVDSEHHPQTPYRLIGMLSIIVKH